MDSNQNENLNITEKFEIMLSKDMKQIKKTKNPDIYQNNTIMSIVNYKNQLNNIYRKKIIKIT